jgi:hypothetical protein
MKRLLVIAAVALAMGAVGGAAATVGVLAYTHHGGSTYFTDVSYSSPHNEDIGWAYEYGIVNGFWDNSYHPGAAVTREQMATYMMRNVAGDPSLAWLIVDYMYFDGYYYGQPAYERGDITYNEWMSYENMFDWYWALVDYQATRAKLEGRDPGMLAPAARALAAHRAKAKQ